MRILFCLPFLLLSSCCDSLILPPPPVTKDVGYCQKAQDNLIKLQCIPEDGTYTKGRGDEKGKTFVQFCQEIEKKGLEINPACIAKLTNCADFTADTCNRDN